MFFAFQLLEAEVFAVSLTLPFSLFFLHIRGPCAQLLDPLSLFITCSLCPSPGPGIGPGIFHLFSTTTEDWKHLGALKTTSAWAETLSNKFGSLRVWPGDFFFNLLREVSDYLKSKSQLYNVMSPHVPFTSLQQWSAQTSTFPSAVVYSK